MKKRYKWALGIIALLLVASFFLALMCGTYSMSVGDVVATLFGGGNKMQNTVVFSIRLPRICIALVVGLALSTAGCILQSVTRNPLAEPGMIGINAGAALAVVLLIASKTTAYYSSIGLSTMIIMPFVAILGAFIAGLIVYALAYRKGITPTRFILVGIGVNAGINAFITFYQLNMSKGDYNQALTWISGSLWGSNWTYFSIVAPIIVLLVLITIYKSNTLDVLDLGEELATGLGVAVQKESRMLLILAVALSAVATAVAGNIAFLGLLGPHIARGLVGPKHNRQIPVGALISSILLILSDTASRNLFTPLEIPVGITVSIIGVPYFVYLMLKEK